MKPRTLTTTLAALLLACTPLHAANFTWDGGALIGSDWSNGLNWSTNIAPPSDGTADLFSRAPAR